MEITINYYGQTVSVSVEVYEYLTQTDHKTENLAHEQRRHWDGREFDEYIIATEGRFYGNFSLSHPNHPAKQGQIRCGRCRLSERRKAGKRVGRHDP